MLWVALLIETSPLLVISAPAPSITLEVLAQSKCEDAGEEVVVCARRRDDRLMPLADPPRSMGPPDGPLSFRLPGGGTGRLRAIETNRPGAKGTGAAVTFSVPF